MWMDISKKNVVVSEIIGIIRDETSNAMIFRTNLTRLGQLLAYEIAEFLDTKLTEVETSLGKAEVNSIDEDIVVISILRAALPMSEGVLEIYSEASIGVVSMSRGKMLQEDGKDFRIDCPYMHVPYLENKVTIIVDPMLASGSTMLYLLQSIENQKPKKIVILCAIACKYGIERILKEHPEVIIIAGAVDPILDERGYIVPGLGDAGDRAFNT
jgi:uracil phosphoribosyltransferase